MQQGFWTLLKWWKVMMYIRKWDALFFFPQDEGLFFLMLLTLLFFEGKYPNVKKGRWFYKGHIPLYFFPKAFAKVAKRAEHW